MRRRSEASAPREGVSVAGDCAFATFAALPLIDPQIAWAKLAALAGGARLASETLWEGAKVEFP
jgi:5-methyltetrahydropteroyltriglutamate--homocysteine methyltransferase